MAPLFRYRLSEREKDALLSEQAALIERLAARVKELEALLAKPKKTSQNSHTPPSQDRCAQRMRSIKLGGGGNEKNGKRRKPRPSRPGSARPLSDAPDETIKRLTIACPHCATDVSGQAQTCRHRYDHIDIPPIAPVVTRIELFGGRCATCGRRFRAAAPDGMAPGSPFATRVRALLLYLHHSHHIGFERLSQMMAELFGLKISEGAIVKAFRRVAGEMTAACAAIKDKLLTARIIASDETTSRIDGATHWHWVFVSAKAVLHHIAPRRAKAVAEEVLGEHRPEIWVSDRYAGQQDLAPAHQVCLAHVLRDVQYAIDCGDTVFAPRLRALLRWAIRIGRRRETLRPTTLQQYHARAERRLDGLVTLPTAHPAGRALQDAVKAWRTKFFVFLEDRDVPATNNACEREIRPSVVFRKVTGGFRSEWGARIHAGYRSVTGTARLSGQTALNAVGQLLANTPQPSPAS
jgi:transposase